MERERFEHTFRGDLLDFSFHKDGAKFTVRENTDGSVAVVLENDKGENFDFASLMPKGWRIIGNKITYESNQYLGLVGTESSLCDYDTETIILSELQIKEDGIKYLFTVLHEIGHIYWDINNPDKMKQMREAEKVSFKDPEAYKKADDYYRMNERSAWAYAIIQLKKILKDLNLDKDFVFENVQEMRNYIREDFLGKAVSLEGAVTLRSWFKALSEQEKKEFVDGLIKGWIK